MIYRAWLQEILLLATGLLPLLWMDKQNQPLWIPVLVVVAAYSSWHLLQLMRFHSWASTSHGRGRPLRFGLWIVVLACVGRLKQHDATHKQRLRELLATFREAGNSLPDAIILIDETRRVEWANQAARRLWPRLAEDGDASTIDSLIPEQDFLDYFDSGEYARSIQISAPGFDSPRLETRVVPFTGYRLLLARDISHLLQLENVRRDFVANASHELRTPLTVIHGYLEAMQDSQDKVLHHWRGALEQMSKQTVRMQRIVEDLLLLSRLERSEAHQEHVPIKVAELLDTIIDEAHVLSGEQEHEIQVQIDRSLGLSGSSTELYSLFSNLIFNAVRYTPARGRIKIEWCLANGKPRFSIEDTGVGIEKHDVPRLTERFYRVDVGRSRKYGGTGLGLAIVKHVLYRHDGELEIHSEPGSGSLFLCKFLAQRAVTKIS